MGKKYIIRGIVQGVGFRPFVYRLATSISLRGRVANTTEGVVVEVDGEMKQLEDFRRRLLEETPPLARIDAIDESEFSTFVAEGFIVAPSDGSGRKRLLITPDSDVCPNCLAELRDPYNRRYRYPFINCTDCGPRYTIIDDLPYDRQYTAMRSFPMCEDCRREYEDPANRRYHAEATCCPVCGPRLWATDIKGREIAGDAIALARSWLADGKIVAVKGIGGFHLAVDATNAEAVRLLRERKRRPDKPLAVMGRDLEAVARFAGIGEDIEKQLVQRTRPIVLAAKKTPFALAANVAPDNRFIGVMLPYTPIHHLLLENSAQPVLVMTSANLSGEPIVIDNHEAIAKLATIADGFLFHDRPILTPTDDSVLRFDAGRVIYLRRARSLAPLPLDLPFDLGRTMAVGADVKSTICLSRGREAFVSQHLGDLDLLATQQNFESTCHHFMRLLQVEPQLVVRDLHPGYFSSTFADSLSLPAVQIQHHHAHAVSCMAEHGIDSEVLALTMDGTGFGPDKTVWGGEVLIAGLSGYRRLAHLRQVRLPGGEAAVRQPWRMALSYLYCLFGAEETAISRIRTVGQEESLVLQMLTAKLNSPLTSSCGRLFDAVAALLKLRERITFEGQAAMELEMLAATDDGICYPFSIDHGQEPWIMDTFPLIAAIVTDIRKKVPLPRISSRFHRSLAVMLTETCRLARKETGIDGVVLSGGVFQNALLSGLLQQNLQDHNFKVYCHRQLPPNDACISLGQAVAGRTVWEENGAKALCNSGPSLFVR